MPDPPKRIQRKRTKPGKVSMKERQRRVSEGLRLSWAMRKREQELNQRKEPDR